LNKTKSSQGGSSGKKIRGFALDEYLKKQKSVGP
jgi:hypothetical protein